MKNLSYISIFIFTSIIQLAARSEISGNMVIFRSLTIAIMDDYVTYNKKLPNSWADIQMIRDMQTNISNENPRQLKVINMLSIVPNAPVLYEAPGISKRLQNMKLFAISRSDSVDPVFSKGSTDIEKVGRYLILASMDMSDIVVNWVTEAEAQAVLGQLKGFDPVKQPLAFADTTESERSATNSKEMLGRQITASYNEQVSQVPNNDDANHQVGKPENNSTGNSSDIADAETKSYGWLLIGCFTVFVFIFRWLKLWGPKA